MSDTAHTRYADWDGAYVLGALSPAERREYEKHLEQCDRCRAAVAELTSMPGLLARLDGDRAEALLDTPLLDGYRDAPDDTVHQGPSPQLLDLVRLEDRRRRGRVGFALAAAAAIIAVAIFAPLGFARLAAPGTQTVALEHVVDVPLSASVKLIPVEWGTQLELACSYTESTDGADTAWSYGLYVTADDGTTSELSTWKIEPGSQAQISAGTELALTDIRSVEIRPVGSTDVLLRATIEE